MSHAVRAAELDQDGYTVWRGLVPHDAIDRHLDEWERFARTHGIDEPPARGGDDLAARRRVASLAERLHYDSAGAPAFWFNPALLDFARWRFGAEPVMRIVFTHLFPLGSHLHSDYLATAAPDPWEREFRCWCALEDIDPDAGPIYFLPGSHRSIMATLREEILRDHPDVADALRAAMRPMTQEDLIATLKPMHLAMRTEMQDRLNRLDLHPVAPALRKGDVILFNPAIAHGTTPAVRLDRTRKAMIFMLGAAETPFYMPRAYWGALHDYRSPVNAVPFQVERAAHGLRVANYMATFYAALAQPIAA